MQPSAKKFECRLRNVGWPFCRDGRFWSDGDGQKRLAGHLASTLHHSNGFREVEVVAFYYGTREEPSDPVIEPVPVLFWREIRAALEAEPSVWRLLPDGRALGGFMLPDLPDDAGPLAVSRRADGYLDDMERAILDAGFDEFHSRLETLARLAWTRCQLLPAAPWVEAEEIGLVVPESRADAKPARSKRI